MSVATFARTVSLLTEPFVRTGIYATQEQALKHIILDYVKRQITWAEEELRRYERRHKQTFDDWTKSLSGQATIADEDEWMEWEATRDMVDGWRKIKAEIEQSRV